MEVIKGDTRSLDYSSYVLRVPSAPLFCSGVGLHF